ncbi:putative serine/threonine-protein kinase PBL19 isoform X1 [Silene latifolia]|uniref:putative serine/threonine-protein kinase PBL19 isoform X1 n=1 Tax=Silene latifolia TaxID=37657 RepID=UPI003D76C041
MGCFSLFKKEKKANAAHELKKQATENVANNRVSKSANSASSSSKTIPELYREKQHNLRVFTYSELREATSGFNKLLKIGEGGFGSVYKGTIQPLNGLGSPIVVAIKKLNKHGLQGHKEFLAEVQFLGVVDNPRLVKLLGYCAINGERGIQRLLVYEYMPNKSLEDHLFANGSHPLPWIQRLKIMLEAAEGLAYLHQGMEVQVIFRDFKSSNVLLDENMQAKLSDFGMAREGPRGEHTHVSTTGHKEFLAEVQFLGVVDNPRLVKLLGYCAINGERGIQRLLVYEYMPNKSLEDHLFANGSHPLPWIQRLKIMLEAAEGLAYLHQGMEVQVIFRDFKSSNVLLDENMQAKLSDFGMAREGPRGEHTHVSTMPVGTYGYAAPEYIKTGHLRNKSDIYSFGVVLYEILTGRRTIERNRPTSEQKLLDWVQRFPADSKMFYMIMDFRLRNQYPLRTARKIAKLADTCLRSEAEDRPDMNEIIEVLKEAILESENSK